MPFCSIYCVFLLAYFSIFCYLCRKFLHDEKSSYARTLFYGCFRYGAVAQ